MSAAPVVGPPRPTIEVPSPAGRILGVGAGVLVASPTARNPNTLGYSTWPNVPDGRQPWPSQFPRSATHRTRRRNILYIKSYLRQSSQSQMKRSATCQGCSQSGGQKEVSAVGSEPTPRQWVVWQGPLFGSALAPSQRAGGRYGSKYICVLSPI